MNDFASFYQMLARHQREKRLRAEAELRELWDLTLSLLNATRDISECPDPTLLFDDFIAKAEYVREELLKIAERETK